jgi:hypothetical protein
MTRSHAAQLAWPPHQKILEDEIPFATNERRTTDAAVYLTFNGVQRVWRSVGFDHHITCTAARTLFTSPVLRRPYSGNPRSKKTDWNALGGGRSMESATFRIGIKGFSFQIQKSRGAGSVSSCLRLRSISLKSEWPPGG